MSNQKERSFQFFTTDQDGKGDWVWFPIDHFFYAEYVWDEERGGCISKRTLLLEPKAASASPSFKAMVRVRSRKSLMTFPPLFVGWRISSKNIPRTKRGSLMLDMRVSDVAEQIVMHVLTEGTGRRQGGDGGRKTEAIYISFDIRLSSYEDSFQYTAARGLHLLYHKLPGADSISVFSAVSPSPFDRLEKVVQWKHEATHDSCWRGLRVFFDVYFEMAKEVNARRVFRGLKEIAPAEMTQCCNFAGRARESLFQWVPVEITKDPEDECNYRRLIKVEG